MLVRIVRVAFRNLVKRPVRTLLVLQGVIWGTALGVVTPAVIQGTRDLAREEATKLGTDRLLLTQEAHGDVRAFDWSLASELDADPDLTIDAIAPLTVIRDGEIPVIATDAGAFAARRQEFSSGSGFGRDDVERGSLVAVVESDLAVRRFGTEDPVGRTVALPDGRDVTIVGVTAPRADLGERLDEMGYRTDHPLRTVVDQIRNNVGVYRDRDSELLGADESLIVPHTLFPDRPPRWIEMRCEPRRVLDLRRALQERLVSSGHEPIIFVNTILPIIYGETLQTVEELNWVVFVISIVVGTAVVCCIMVLSVMERQREIAIRRVEGARRWHVAIQFVVETAVLSGVGAVLGIPLGFGLAELRTRLDPHGTVTWGVPGIELVILLVAVIGIGMLGGLLPAWRAARVDPVEILRNS